ncbi:hypothetical protein MLD38_024204 [Melastoma candidum]|uniref:Uncharacterized protein n=1 Tax=Melastoma candidum TaxID=119954 RepID=A0ACB9NU88_9MYRT|nr:hypothetical protein MLD38_024204 [Melastoma candidum]
MDRFLRCCDGDLRASIADSAMMWMVHEEMQRAHEKVKTKDSTARLNEISKFYQLAVIQLEVCHKFVQQETEDGHHQGLLDDLGSIRDHLRGRQLESEAAIAEKDRELLEMAENELRLRKALEAKEREVVLLRRRLESACSPRWMVDGDEETSDAVDWRAGDETSRIGKGEGRAGFETMIAPDIDAFKETLDMAFGKMRDAIVMSETEPSDQQMVSTMERDVLVVSVKEFVADVKTRFEAEQGIRLAQDADLEESRVSELLSSFTHQVYGKLSKHTARLEDMKRQTDSCTEQVASLRQKERLYREAFVVTSQNLRKAENEVDLLADQVDRLLDTLESVYVKLCRHSPILEQHSDIWELLASVHRELKGV